MGTARLGPAFLNPNAAVNILIISQSCCSLVDIFVVSAHAAKRKMPAPSRPSGSKKEKPRTQSNERGDTHSKSRQGRKRGTRRLKFDVAISFAGTERDVAEQLAIRLRDAGYAVFYDNFYPADLWGKELPVFFDEIYRTKSQYCVIFVSKEYAKRMWTNRERMSAQARAIEEKGKESE